MDAIIKALVDAGYFRARINTLSDFDKIIGGMAWAMQVFSHDININIFYADTLDLGQKIALTERLVMVLLVMNCPHQIEPHQIVGLDYVKLLPVIRWLIKRSAEVRREHEAFNRLHALRYFFRVTNCSLDRSQWCHIVPVEQVRISEVNLLEVQEEGDKDGEFKKKTNRTSEANTQSLIEKINEDFKANQRVSFVKLPILYGAQQALSRQEEGKLDLSEGESTEDEDDKANSSTGTVVKASEYNTKTEIVGNKSDDQSKSLNDSKVSEIVIRRAERSAEEVALHKELDTELLATNQKILNLLKKLDSMPSQLEIGQYQKRYIELHQQLISKNKDLKKLYALFNSLDSIKHYLTKEINLLESIMSNLDLTTSSATNRFEFLRQFEEITSKIQSVRDDVISRLNVLRDRCNALNVEYVSLSIE